MPLRLRTVSALRLLLAAAVVPSAAAAAHAQTLAPYVVVVNHANPVGTLSREDVARLFLRKQPVWPTGKQVMPVDYRDESALRRAFASGVLKKDIPALKGYWQQMIFTGRGVPPVDKSKESDVLAYVAENPSAIGYVSTAAATSRQGVKVVLVFQ